MAANLLIALGSNKRHGRHGSPAGVVAAAIAALGAALGAAGLPVVRASRIYATAPLGPGGRAYANAVVTVASDLPLPEVLGQLKGIEAAFGRRGGRRWGARVLDLDIIGQGAAVTPSRLGWRAARRGLIVPHPRLAARAFVLDPLCEIAPDWRHPLLGATVRQLRARLRRPKATRPSP